MSDTQNRLLQQERDELTRRFDVLSTRIGALDKDIARTRDSVAEQILKEQREDFTAERKQVAHRLEEIETQLAGSTDPDHPVPVQEGGGTGAESSGDIASLNDSQIGEDSSASTPASQEERTTPKWAPIAGLLLGSVTLFFFMGIVIASLFGIQIPSDTRFIVVAVLALGAGLSTSFLGGWATAQGYLPLEGNSMQISVGGGIAVLIIVMVLGYSLYIRHPGTEDTNVPPIAEFGGRVIDDTVQAMPIAGAKVSLYFQGSPSKIKYTDSEGMFSFGIAPDVSGLTGQLRVDANGYEYYEKWLKTPPDHEYIIRLSASK